MHIKSDTGTVACQSHEEAIRLSEERYALIFNNPAESIFIVDVDPDGDFIFDTINSCHEMLSGFTHEQIHGKRPEEVLSPEVAAHVRERYRRCVAAAQMIDYEEILDLPGGVHHYHTFLTPVFDNMGRIVKLLGTARDITAIRTAEKQLRLLEVTVENANDAILITEAEPIDYPGPRIVYVNKAFTKMTGYEPSEIIGKSPRILQGADTDRIKLDAIRGWLSKWEPFEVELKNYCKDGTPFWVELSVKPVADADDIYTHWISIQRDISERKLMEAESERVLHEALRLAETDQLTGLLNHRAFNNLLEVEAQKACRSHSSLTVALIDLDNFKFFNDAYGHLAGDEVLRNMACALRETCQPGDLSARFGGDEFALAFLDCTSDEANRRLADLRDRLDTAGFQPPDYESPIPLTVSVGISVFPAEAANCIEALHLADTRLIMDKQGAQEEVTEHLRAWLNKSVEGFSMLDALVTAVDKTDRYTRRHSDDIVIYGVMIARELGMDAEMQQTIQIAALLHDVGKIGVPDYILRRPGRLTEDDYLAIKQHPVIGAMMVGSVPGLENTLDAVRHHHERWDGKGYPSGLHGDTIPLIARLMAVADAFSAMTTDRPYRKALSPNHALRILEAGAGIQWDPKCVNAFVSAYLSATAPVDAATPIVNLPFDPLRQN